VLASSLLWRRAVYTKRAARVEQLEVAADTASAAGPIPQRTLKRTLADAASSSAVAAAETVTR